MGVKGAARTTERAAAVWLGLTGLLRLSRSGKSLIDCNRLVWTGRAGAASRALAEADSVVLAGGA